MLRPHPAVLRRLVDEYEALAAAVPASDPAAVSARARDLAYTLCVSTGTRDVERALEVAHQWLATAPAPARETIQQTVTGQHVPTPEPA
ncbi:MULTISPECIES: DUF5133 domain-containing protein [Streptomyces]|uniref:DUF5133 domain-containing protein n=1 Tax=Streptomyces chartreusis NRRL 3882 TaxID=1079985 RepID=A0A2N9B0S4_STRCX|nr:MULTISPECIES: DUF5133 domain-containing protein [Streptomyces]MYS90857.1 DUF5133 domain-containing protein [Streptomyces sp. SID5464]SOR76935.1 hypothetical protein SCNRRL3882_0413 [Streptomyces chartreusis NRRL 3882]